jgi:glycosyltransferase involved in cell wall biosynthesis
LTDPVFDRDDHPGRPRILFIGYAGSPHTQSWIDLLRGSALNVRLFSPYPEDTAPAERFEVRTYLSIPGWVGEGPYRRATLPPAPPTPEPRIRERFWARIRAPIDALRRPAPPPPKPLPAEQVERQLAEVIETWRPDVVHTLGLFNAGLYYHDVAERFGLAGRARWLLQLRGGSDLQLNRFVPEARQRIVAAASAADQILSDNRRNFEYLEALGIPASRFSRIGTAPGSGGLDLSALGDWAAPTGARRVILWPKAYHTQFATALPVIEGLRLAWPRMQPCRLVLLWTVQEDVRLWLMTLPEEMRAGMEIHGRVDHREVLRRAAEARVVLAPSLVDGVPNVLYEAMAGGAVPIVSPIDTIADVVREPDNVLFARNLYPTEIAAALERAMTDDALVSRIAATNREVVRRLADRNEIRARVLDLYQWLATLPRGG